MNRNISKIGKVALFCAVGFSLSSVRAQILNLKWNANNEFVHSTTVQPNKILEVCGPMNVGDTLSWSFDADAPLSTNVHFHVGKEVIYAFPETSIASLNAQKATIQRREDYCWMWTNKSERTIALRMNLKIEK